MIAAAQTRSIEQFRQMTGSGKKASIEAVVEGADTARVLQAIVDILKKADRDVLLAFEEVLETAMDQGEGNARMPWTALSLHAGNSGDRKE